MEMQEEIIVNCLTNDEAVAKKLVEGHCYLHPPNCYNNILQNICKP